MRAVLGFILLTITCWQMPEVAGGEAGAGAAECRSVRVELGANTFRSAGYVRAFLKSDGPEVIFLRPSVLRAQRRSTEAWLPSLEGLQASIRPESPPRAYNFSKPGLVGIRWRDVATDETEESYVVMAGRYRLVLLYTAVDPAEFKSRKVEPCTSISPEFVIERDGTLYSTQ